MKRSNQVLLTTIFLAAVSSYTARAQDVNSHTEKQAHSDSTDVHHTAITGGHGRGRHFLFFGHGNHTSAPGNLTYGPRANVNGFGNTLRTTSSGHS